jgi:hypothetical protein
LKYVSDDRGATQKVVAGGAAHETDERPLELSTTVGPIHVEPVNRYALPPLPPTAMHKVADRHETELSELLAMAEVPLHVPLLSVSALPP